MRLRDYATTMARYSRWMNERLYQSAAALTEEQRRADLGAFFKSVHGTLSHILLADNAWLARFTGEPVTMKSARDELRTDFGAMTADRTRTDAAIEAWADTVSEMFAERPYCFYSIVYGESRTVPGWVAVAQMFNHQTHHRGQATTLLMQLGIDPGVTDLPWMPSFDAPRAGPAV